jgi:hypothetical protein
VADADDEPTLFDFAGDGDDARGDPDPDPDAHGAARSSADEGEADPADDAPRVADLDREGRVALGVELIEQSAGGEVPLSELVDRLEAVTTDPAVTREILDTAETRGLIERDGARVRTRTDGTVVRFESRVVVREGDFDCRRCGAGVTAGHFVRLDTGELGPFGSSCVRKVTGRE